MALARRSVARGRQLAVPAVDGVAVVVLALVVSRAASLAGFLVAARGDVARALATMAGRDDAGWYQILVMRGYQHPSFGNPTAGFYFGYPLLVDAVYRPLLAAGRLLVPSLNSETGAGHVLLVACLLGVANASLALAVWALWALYRPLLGEVAAAGGIALLVCQPDGFFLSAGYSESPFLAAAALSFLALARRRWLLAGVAAAAACLIRSPGFGLAIPIVLAWLAARPRPAPWPVAGAVGLVLAGAAAFPGYTLVAFGDPLLYFHLQAHNWHHHLSNPLYGAAWVLGRGMLAVEAAALGHGVRDARLIDVPTLVADAVTLAAAGVALLQRPRRLPVWQLSWIAVEVLLPLSSGVFDSMSRYLLAAFPMYFALAAALRRRPFAIAVICAMGCASILVMAYRHADHVFVG